MSWTKEQHKEYQKSNMWRWKLSNAKSYLKHKEKRLLYSRNRVRKLRSEVLNLLGNKCKVCGWEDVRAIHIDHVNGGGQKEMKRLNFNSGALYRKVLRGGGVGYQLLCANHNAIKRYENREVGVK